MNERNRNKFFNEICVKHISLIKEIDSFNKINYLKI